eukprot:TRINITY_DN9016_c0_g1_i1.p1 TRINITY_DN9016_c0_g1~~TRINITY_DN9016_c0_g1_i1.p1  ORF type:complete len:1131 (-),score=286.14 TRINITY_DN9016_c0_g1_i1:171-3563(-)
MRLRLGRLPTRLPVYPRLAPSPRGGGWRARRCQTRCSVAADRWRVRTGRGTMDWFGDDRARLPDEDDLLWDRRTQACKRSVCQIAVRPVCWDAVPADGTGWVVRNDRAVAALVTAAHVVLGVLGEDGRLDGEVTATFDARRAVGLTGARVLRPSEPPSTAAAAANKLDVAVVFLEAGEQFPSPPVPCELIASAVGGWVDGNTDCALLHHPGGHADVVVSPRGSLLPAAPGRPPWIVAHDTVSAGGSSGGMLLDRQCRGLAVHVAQRPGGTKDAVLLGAVHEGLGDASPWAGLDDVVHQTTVVFQLPTRCAYFIGRAAELQALSRMVQGIGQAVVASTGLPGVGKSMLVLEWAHRVALSGTYGLVAWLRADTVDNLQGDLGRLGVELGLPLDSMQDKAPSARAAFVTQWLSGRHVPRPALLVFDNTDDHDAVEDLVPMGDHCRIVFTARSKRQFRADHVLPLRPFPPDEAVALLKKLHGALTGDGQLAVAAELCAEVGHLPLAVVQLALFAKDSDVTLESLLDRVRLGAASADAMLSAVWDYPRRASVIAALQLVQKGLNEPATRVLQRLALLAPDRVPRELLGAEADVGLLQLGGLGMVAYSSAGLVSTHRLVLAVAAVMPTEARATASSELLVELNTYTDGFRQEDRAGWGPTAAVVPHTAAFFRSSPPVPGDEGALVFQRWWILTGRLLFYHLRCVSDHAAALSWAEVRCFLVDTLCPADVVWVLEGARGKATSLCKLGRCHVALTVCDAALARYVAVLGEDNMDVARTQYDMANILSTDGRNAEALEQMRRVLRKYLVLLDEEDAEVAVVQHEMATLLKEQGDHEEALALYQEALRKKVAVWGREHTSVGVTLHAMGRLLMRLGRANEALPLWEESLRIQMAALGEQHAEVLATRVNLAHGLREVDRDAEALELLELALRTEKAVLGEDAIEVARTEEIKARTLWDVGRPHDAVELFGAVLRKKTAVLGEEHADVALTKFFMAQVVHALRDGAGALALLEEALHTMVAVLGEASADAASVRLALARVLADLGRVDEAVAASATNRAWGWRPFTGGIPRSVVERIVVHEARPPGLAALLRGAGARGACTKRRSGWMERPHALAATAQAPPMGGGRPRDRRGEEGGGGR